jgi:DNA polymerase-3 subunit alpha
MIIVGELIMKNNNYSSLHNHSHMSVLDGYATPEEYLQKASEIGIKAFAITEHGNQYSWVYFDKLKKDYPDIKMIYGVELYECFDINIQDKDNKYFHLIALAKNESGRIALNEIVTKSNFEGFYYKPRVDLNLLKPYAENLIVSSACLASKLSKELDYQKCIEYVNEYKIIFPNFYLELQSHSHQDQIDYNRKVLQLAHDTGTSFIITTDSHSATKEDLYYQARHVQIAHDSDTLSESYEGCYLQSEEEIHEIMDGQIGVENVNIGLDNTNKIADMIDVVNMPFQEPQLPTYPLPEGFKDNFEYLKKITNDGWIKRNINKLSIEEQTKRQQRLEYELNIIHQMKFDGYFLIVWDLVNWAKNNDIMVGPGRGSAGGSIVCYLSQISDLDPIKYDLIFERFLNPERVSMPDIDLDFSDRDKVIEYLTQKYGEESVCQIINFSYITPVVAIKDVARVLGIPYQVSDKISKKFTYETFQECIDNNSDLYEQYAEYKELFDIAGKLSGRVRQASIHAGGVGIVDTKITDYMGMKLGSKGERVIQVDKKKVEEIGIIKFDILGVATLVMMQEMIKDLNLDMWQIDINNPEFEFDEKAYKILQEAKSNGVFQVESSGMKDLLTRLQPNNLEDLSAVLALYRPDSMSMLEDYIYYKHNPSEIKYWHDDLKPILEKTYGCIIYQEEIMDIVRVFGGRTYGGADKFRKGIGKKDKKLVKEESEKLYQEIIDNDYNKPLAKQLSDYMAEMGGYSFNKSHSALYAVICLQTAWLKSHYPEFFYKALLNLNKDDYGALNKYIIDAKQFGIEILPPQINKSEKGFVVDNGKILFGLQAIKGIGEKFVEQILEERKNGKFENFKDFKQRLNPTTTQIITLVKAGAVPTKNKREFLVNYGKSLYEVREYKPVAGLPKLAELRDKWNINPDIIKNKETRLKLYNEKRKIEFDKLQKQKFYDNLNEFVDKYLQNEQFWEFEALSIFINNNPFERVYQFITPFEEVEDGSKGVIIGIVANVSKKTDKKGKQFAFLSMYSAFGLIDVICWHSQFKEYQDLIKRGNQLALLCKKNNDRVTVEAIKTYEQWLIDKKIDKKEK